jgi:hypothetical protein
METIPQLILSMISISFNWRSGEDITIAMKTPFQNAFFY